jgi:heat shock protein HtpX
MTVTATLAGAISAVARMAYFASLFGPRRDSEEEGGGLGGALGAVLTMILAPIAAMLIQMAISRAREYHADATGARIAGKATGLARALEKLETAARVAPMEAAPATAHLFIVNPLSGGAFVALFSTHPPVAERVARLRAMRI